MGKPRPASQKKSTGGKPLRTGKEAGKAPGTSGQGSSDDQKSSHTSTKDSSKKGTSGAAAKLRITKKKHERARHAGAHGLLPKLEAEGTKKSSISPAQAKRRKRAANSTALGVVSGIRSSLEELLEETEKRNQTSRTDGSTSANASRTKSSLNNKRRVKLVAEETRHLKEVIEHPAFVANPMAALREHLKNTVAPKPPRERG